MKNLFYIFLLSLLLISCSTTRTVNIVTNGKEEMVDISSSDTQFRDDFTHVPVEAKEAFLIKHKANESNYTMLFLTLGYKGEIVKIYSPTSTIYNGTTYTLKSNGIAGYMRVSNAQDILITDDYSKTTVLLESKYLKKYKFVYVMKDNTKNKPYTVTYSNNLRPL